MGSTAGETQLHIEGPCTSPAIERINHRAELGRLPLPAGESHCRESVSLFSGSRRQRRHVVHVVQVERLGDVEEILLVVDGQDALHRGRVYLRPGP